MGASGDQGRRRPFSGSESWFLDAKSHRCERRWSPFVSSRVNASVKAGGEGFEPPLTVPETAVLPLDDPPGIVVRAFCSSDGNDFTMESGLCKVRAAGSGEGGKPHGPTLPGPASPRRRSDAGGGVWGQVRAPVDRCLRRASVRCITRDERPLALGASGAACEDAPPGEWNGR